MSKRSQTLRALVTERLTAAAEEIFELVERTIAEYEEELCRSKEENQQLLEEKALAPQQVVPVRGAADVQTQWSPELSLKQEVPESPQIKEEPEEPEELSIKQEEQQLPQVTVVCVKSEEQRQTHNDADWEPPASASAAQMETEADGDHDTSPAAHSSALFTKTKSAPEAGAAVRDEHAAGKHECPFCQKRLANKYWLTVHTRVHTGERPYSCSTCQKTFTNKGDLKKHVKTHTGERPFSCPVCQKAFYKRDHLRTHMTLHTGDRPYSCSVCQRVFAQKGNLNFHMKSHKTE